MQSVRRFVHCRPIKDNCHYLSVCLSVATHCDICCVCVCVCLYVVIYAAMCVRISVMIYAAMCAPICHAYNSTDFIHDEQ